MTPAPAIPLTARQQREAAFYRHYAARQRDTTVDLDPVTAAQRRPWNPYWHVYDLVLDHRDRIGRRNLRLLDFGCGTGVAAIRFAHAGFDVHGFDLSPDNLAVARSLAHRHGVADRCTFDTMPAEALTYPDACFDLVVGIDILHHIEIAPAIAHAARVLKPDGLAVFKEHVHAPAIDRLRDSTLGRRLAPKTTSLDLHITEDERKLTRDDLAVITAAFDDVTDLRFTLLGRCDRLLWRRPAVRAALQRLDHRLLTACPALRPLAGTALLACRRPRLPA